MIAIITQLRVVSPSTSSSKAKTHRRPRLPLQDRSTTLRAKNIPPSFVPMADPSGPTMPSSPISPSSLPPMATPSPPQPRGSTGYGENFAKAIYADWGNKDYQDDMAIVDYAIAQGIADPDKLAVGALVLRRHLHRFHKSPRPPASKPRSPGAGEANNTRHVRSRPIPARLHHRARRPLGESCSLGQVSPFYKVTNITRPPSSWVAISTGTSHPRRRAMYQAMKSLGRETQLVVYPANTMNLKPPATSKTASSVTWPGTPTT